VVSEGNTKLQFFQVLAGFVNPVPQLFQEGLALIVVVARRHDLAIHFLDPQLRARDEVSLLVNEFAGHLHQRPFARRHVSSPALRSLGPSPAALAVSLFVCPSSFNVFCLCMKTSFATTCKGSLRVANVPVPPAHARVGVLVGARCAVTRVCA
jgi:hypothetical protein